MKKSVLFFLVLIISCQDSTHLKEKEEKLSKISVEIFNGIKPYAYFYNVDFDENTAYRFMINIHEAKLLPPEDYRGSVDERMYGKDSASGNYYLKNVPKSDRVSKFIKLSKEQKELLLQPILSFDTKDKYSNLQDTLEINSILIVRYHLVYTNGEIVDIERVYNQTEKQMEFCANLSNLFGSDTLF